MIIKVYCLVKGCKCRSYNRRCLSHLAATRNHIGSYCYCIEENLLRRASVLIKVDMRDVRNHRRSRKPLNSFPNNNISSAYKEPHLNIAKNL